MLRVIEPPSRPDLACALIGDEHSDPMLTMSFEGRVKASAPNVKYVVSTPRSDPCNVTQTALRTTILPEPCAWRISFD